MWCDIFFLLFLGGGGYMGVISLNVMIPILWNESAKWVVDVLRADGLRSVKKE